MRFGQIHEQNQALPLTFHYLCVSNRKLQKNILWEERSNIGKQGN